MTELAVDYGDQQIAFSVTRAARASLDIEVSPDGLVVVRAPLDADLDQILSRVRKRARWVLEQQRYFAQFRPRTPARRWVPGETHRYLGRQFRLRIADAGASAPRVHLSRGFLLIDGIAFADSAGIERVVRTWYRTRAREVVERRLPVCAARFAVPVSPAALSVRAMRSRWASMSPSGRMTVNPELLRAPTTAIDYVLTHELAHRIVADHGPRFHALLDEVMPDHALRKHRLERATA